MPDSNDQINNWLSDKLFSLSGLVKGKVDQLNIAYFNVGSVDNFSLKSEGNVAFVTDLEKVSGNLNVALLLIEENFFHRCYRGRKVQGLLFRITWC